MILTLGPEAVRGQGRPSTIPGEPRSTSKVVRSYSDEAGESHVAELPLSYPTLTSLQASEDASIRRVEAGRFADWHVAPRRQYVAHLSAEVEIVMRRW